MNIVRGDTGAFKFQRLNAGGEPITSTPDAMFFTVKKSYSFNAYVLQKSMLAEFIFIPQKQFLKQ